MFENQSKIIKLLVSQINKDKKIVLDNCKKIEKDTEFRNISMSFLLFFEINIYYKRFKNYFQN